MYRLKPLDYLVAAIGLMLVIGAHVWLHFLPNFGDRDWHQDKGADIERPPCEYYPNGVDGIKCRNYGPDLIPPGGPHLH